MPSHDAFQLDLFLTTERSETAAGTEAPTAPKATGPQKTAPTPPPSPRPKLDPASAPRLSSSKSLVPEIVRGHLLLQRLGEWMPDRLSSITLTNNRTSIISAREKAGKLDLRIHRSFADAPDETLQAVAGFLLSPRRSTLRRSSLATIRAYFRDHQATSPAKPRPPRRIILRPVGQTVDLRQLREAVNQRYFAGELTVHISWGRAPSRRKRRQGRGYSVRLGTYSERDNVVRIHPCLDDPKVPRYVVESVVHHEMLHAALPAVVVNGRRHVHTPEFRRRERLFSHFNKAERWLDRHLARLIGAV